MNSLDDEVTGGHALEENQDIYSRCNCMVDETFNQRRLELAILLINVCFMYICTFRLRQRERERER